MNIAIIGAGNVGRGLARHLVAAGQDVTLSFTLRPEELDAAARETGAGAAEPEAAVAEAEVVILATPWATTLDVVKRLAGDLAGKTLWDCTNTLKPDLSGLELGTTFSGGEAVQEAAPEAQVVKAIPPFADILNSDRLSVAGHRPEILVCTDAHEAGETVSTLISDIGLAPRTAGPLSMARYTEPFGMLLVQLAYFQGLGSRITAPIFTD